MVSQKVELMQYPYPIKDSNHLWLCQDLEEILGDKTSQGFLIPLSGLFDNTCRKPRGRGSFVPFDRDKIISQELFVKAFWGLPSS
jgi:hypothetical protein